MLKNKVNIKKQRVIKYFIEAATQIAKDEGIDKVTIRKVSDLAGYNSATLYNYFENLEHLLGFTAINCISDYWNDIANISNKYQDAITRYVHLWKSYCYNSFSNPSIYTYIFITTKNKNVLNYTKEYFNIFHDSFYPFSDDIRDLILEADRNKRDILLISPCVSEGYFSADSINEITEFSYLLHEGLLYEITHYEGKYEVDEAVGIFLKYLINFLEQKNISGKPLVIQDLF